MSRPDRNSDSHSHPVEHPSTHGHLHIPNDTPVHRLDPAARLIGLAAFVIIVALTPRTAVWAFAADIVVVGAVVAAARLPIRVVVSRLTVLMPVFVAAVLLAIFGGGRRVDVGPVSVSVDGSWAAWGIVIKATLGCTASIIFAATTPVPDIIDALGRLRLPTVIVSIVAFMFRYLDLLADQVVRMRQSMTARAYDPRWVWQVKPIAQSSGTLFVRTYERGERVHLAMLARGFTGTMPTSSTSRPPVRDLLAALVPAAIALGAALAAFVLGGNQW